MSDYTHYGRCFECGLLTGLNKNTLMCETHDYEKRIKDLEQKLSEEQQRTLRYKELLYSQSEQGEYIKELEERRDEWRKEHKEQIAANHELMTRYMEAMEVVRFYGDPELYYETSEDEFMGINGDYEKLDTSEHPGLYAGKRAREFMKKHGMEEG